MRCINVVKINKYIISDCPSNCAVCLSVSDCMTCSLGYYEDTSGDCIGKSHQLIITKNYCTFYLYLHDRIPTKS